MTIKIEATKPWTMSLNLVSDTKGAEYSAPICNVKSTHSLNAFKLRSMVGTGLALQEANNLHFGLPTPDIVILDNNLAELTIPGARHTAESIAGYIRAFTNIPYIVSLNKNPDIDFDLRYLMGDRHTQADVRFEQRSPFNPCSMARTTAIRGGPFPTLVLARIERCAKQAA